MVTLLYQEPPRSHLYYSCPWIGLRRHSVQFQNPVRVKPRDFVFILNSVCPVAPKVHSQPVLPTQKEGSTHFLYPPYTPALPPFTARSADRKDQNQNLKDSATRFSTLGFFHKSVSPKPLSIPTLGPFQFFFLICGDIRSSRCGAAT